MVELAAKVAAFRRAAIPITRFGGVPLTAPAFFQTTRSKVHRARMTLASGPHVPIERLTLGARQAAAIEECIAEVIFSPGVTGLRGLPIAVSCCFEVYWYSKSHLVTATQHIESLGIAPRGGASKPAHGLGRITRSPVAGEQYPAEQELRRKHAVFSGASNPDDRVDRIPGKQRA